MRTLVHELKISASAHRDPVSASGPPVPGPALLRAEGLAALDVRWLAEQDLSVLDQAVDPRAPVRRHPQHSLTADRRPLGRRQVVHGEQQPGWRTGREVGRWFGERTFMNKSSEI